jgi:hypothetical protein
MQTIETLRAAWQALKLHEEQIMTRRPADVPRGAWREENRPGFDTAFRAKRNGKPVSLALNIDAGPAVSIYSTGSAAKLVEVVKLDADDALAGIEWPAPNDMTNREFAAIRSRLGLTQAQLAIVLDYAAAINVSAMERVATPRAIPKHIARLMRAYDAGYRPSDWPK